MGSDGLLFTGLYWERDRPTLTGMIAGREHARPVEPGRSIGWEITGPRRCTGVYDRRDRRRLPCPAAAISPDDSQCELCRRSDPGRLVARGQAPEWMEREPFALYLAWFGDGLHKVGITAAERDAERLCEQAALSYCLVASGAFTVIRQAEALLSGTGVASERVTSRSKQAAWWRVPPAHERAARLAPVHLAACEMVGSFAGIELRPFDAVDLVPLYGLDRELPSAYELVTAVRDGAVGGGEVSHIIGKFLVLGSSSPIVIDSRLLEGWTLRRSSRIPTGLDVETRSREADARVVQEKLF